MEEVKTIIETIKLSCVQIADEISHRSSLNMSNIVAKNKSDDDVKALDIISNTVLITNLQTNRFVKIIASEEDDELIHINDDTGKYIVAFDPRSDN